MESNWDKLAETYPVESRNSLDRALDIVRNETSGRTAAVDIGCGPGNFTIQLAGLFDRVYSSDLSVNMLERMERECASREITNVRAINSDALELSLPEPCDLAFSSLCPGITGTEGLRKLDSLSRDLCVYVTHDNDSSCEDRELLDALGLEPIAWKSLDFVSDFSQDHDVRTERVIDTTVWKSRREAEDRYVRRSDGTPEAVKRISDYFDEHDPTGTTQQNAKLIVYWHKR